MILVFDTNKTVSHMFFQVVKKIIFFLGDTSTIEGCFLRLFLWVCCSGSTRRLNREEVFGEARDRTCDPWFTRRVT